MKRLKVMQNAGVLYIFTCKCASRYNGVRFFHIWTSKSGPYPSVFWHFEFKMCFSLQRRAFFPHRNFKKWSEHAVFFVHFDLKRCFSLQRHAIFPHLNFKKWSEHAVFCTFWLQNVLLATAACNFSTSQLQKVVRTCSVLYIFTWKRASRYSGVQFFHIWTSKSAPRPSVFYDFDCASRYSGVQFFISELNSYLRTRRFSEVTFRPSRHTNHWKTQHFATSLTFRACGSSFYWLSRNCIFSSSDSTSFLCFFIFWLCYSALLFNCPYCRKLDF